MADGLRLFIEIVGGTFVSAIKLFLQVLFASIKVGAEILRDVRKKTK